MAYYTYDGHNRLTLTGMPQSWMIAPRICCATCPNEMSLLCKGPLYLWHAGWGRGDPGATVMVAILRKHNAQCSHVGTFFGV
mmetsp:Transcript_53976/g.96083  ORF Transcript_53976/g.96083 Transcript_53976/m.96083 type:complete len:82 (-) Transcript_53976:54-299(-)